MYAYKTNSAEYLDYVAATLTREQIKADPDLCLLLENEYIKDNMELAIRYNQSKFGDYQDKYDFVEYYLCNGPEVDADTMLHYRAKIYNDPVCLEIAYSYLSDVDQIAKLRKSVYGKDTDGCFQNPCFYLGRFSSVMGSTGDSDNTRSLFNIIGGWINGALDDEKLAEARLQNQVNNGTLTEEEKEARLAELKVKETVNEVENAVIGSNDLIKPASSGIPNGDSLPPPPPTGGISKHFQQVIIPSIKQGWNMMVAQMTTSSQEFTKELVSKTRGLWDAKCVGDWMAQPLSEMISLANSANVHRNLGDCARMWKQVRGVRMFGPENNFAPIRPDQLVGDKNVDGTPINPISNPQPTVNDASVTVSGATEILVTNQK